jgi:hypothetical protein
MAPFGVHQGGENVDHIAPPFSKNVLEIHVTAAIFVKQTPSCSSLLSSHMLWGIAWVCGVHIYKLIVAAMVAHSFLCLGHAGEFCGSKSSKCVTASQFEFSGKI